MTGSSNGHRVYWCRCGQKLRVPREKLGREGDCPGCGVRIHPTMENTLPHALDSGRAQGPAKEPGMPAPPPGAGGVPTPPPVARYTLMRGGHEAVVRKNTAREPEPAGEMSAPAPPPSAAGRPRPSRKLTQLWREHERLCAELGARVYEASDRLTLDAQMDRLVQELARCERRITDEEGAHSYASRTGDEPIPEKD